MSRAPRYAIRTDAQDICANSGQAGMPAGSTQSLRQQVVVVEPIRVFDPFLE
jgi:hypothetical protein